MLYNDDVLLDLHIEKVFSKYCQRDRSTRVKVSPPFRATFLWQLGFFPSPRCFSLRLVQNTFAYTKIVLVYCSQKGKPPSTPLTQLTFARGLIVFCRASESRLENPQFRPLSFVDLHEDEQPSRVPFVFPADSEMNFSRHCRSVSAKGCFEAAAAAGSAAVFHALVRPRHLAPSARLVSALSRANGAANTHPSRLMDSHCRYFFRPFSGPTFESGERSFFKKSVPSDQGPTFLCTISALGSRATALPRGPGKIAPPIRFCANGFVLSSYIFWVKVCRAIVAIG